MKGRVTESFIGIVLTGLGATVMVGWIAAFTPIVQLHENFVAMVFSTALCFTFVGCAFLIPKNAVNTPLHYLLGVLVLIIGFLSFLENIFDQNLGVDFSGFHRWLTDGNPRPGRMAPNTALCFVFLGLLIILMQSVRRRAAAVVVQFSTFTVLFLGLAGLVGYALDLSILYGFRSTRMAVHTAAGMVVASLGFWYAWIQEDWYQGRRLFSDADKIVFVGTALLIVAALTIGIAGLAAQQTTYQKNIADKLTLAVKNQATVFDLEINQAIVRAQLNAGRVTIVRLSQTLAASPNNEDAQRELRAIAQVVLGTGLTALAIHDVNGRELLELERFTSSPDIAVDLGLKIPATLLWDEGFKLRLQMPIEDHGRVVGTLVSEEQLSAIINQLVPRDILGETGETRLCTASDLRLRCFPDRTHSKPYAVDAINFLGQETPMYMAIKGESGVYKGRDFVGDEVVAAYQPLSSTGFGLVIKKNTDELFAPLREQSKRNMSILLLLAIAAAYVLHTQIKPLARKLANSEAEANAKEKHIRTIMDNVGEGIITINEAGVITSFNKAASTIFGYPAEEMLGENIRVLMEEEMRDRHDAGMQRYLSGAPPVVVGLKGVELPGLHKDGSKLSLELTINEIDLQGNCVFVGILRDIGERKRNELKLRLAMQHAETANKAKTEFVANMSHEIRTPLNAVLGMAQLLEKTPLQSEQKKYLDMIIQSGKSLLGILNDILDFSKIEAGKMDLAPVQFRLSDVLHSLSSIMSVSAGKKNLELIIDTALDIPPMLVGDAHRLHQVLVNLISNAIKFTEAGEVSVKIDISKHQDQNVYLRFTVRDTGIGMTSVQLERLFTSFTQADSSITRRFGGTGLGLTISERLTHLMGGTIEVNSVLGRGSNFLVTIPFALADKAERRASVRHPLKPFRLLLIEDHSLAREAICKLVRSWRWTADTAASGKEALNCIRTSVTDGTAYDVILLDWQLPGIDGVDMLEAIGEISSSRSPAVILMVNAYGREKLRQDSRFSALPLQPAAYLFKPLTASSLFDTLIELFGTDHASKVSRDNSPLPQPLKGRLLLVEDNDFNQIVARDLLEQAGAVVDIVDNGKKAVDLLATNSEKYDVVLMDVQMPVMDGFTATRAIRNKLKLDIPVIAMTAGVTEFEQEECKACGMNDVIAKPIEAAVMVATIARYLDETKRAFFESPVPAQVNETQSEFFDISKLLAMSGAAQDNGQKIILMLQKLIDNVAVSFSAAQKAYLAKSSDDLGRVLHSLRGTVGMLGAKTFCASALKLENVLTSNGEQRDIDVLFSQVEYDLSQTLDAARLWIQNNRR